MESMGKGENTVLKLQRTCTPGATNILCVNKNNE